jgi:hypothetical protein
MKRRAWKMENSEGPARSALERGSPLPLSTPGDRPALSQSARGLAQSKTRRLCLLLCLLSSACCLQAQGLYSIDWSKVSGGGGSSTGGVYTVSGTIGQHDSGGPMVGGNFSLTSGFWSLLSVVQTPGAPRLFISHSSTVVTIYWQNVSGWTLQQNSSVTSPSGWSASDGVTTSSGTNYLNLSSPTGSLFFRLRSG